MLNQMNQMKRRSAESPRTPSCFAWNQSSRVVPHIRRSLDHFAVLAWRKQRLTGLRSAFKLVLLEGNCSMTQ